jgi:hypothetical protein
VVEEGAFALVVEEPFGSTPFVIGMPAGEHPGTVARASQSRRSILHFSCRANDEKRETDCEGGGGESIVEKF